MPLYDDASVFYDDPAIFYDAEEGPALNPLNQPLPSLGATHMEYWEITKDRAQATLAVWNLHVPALTIGGLTAAQFGALIGQFEPTAQARTTLQDAFDAKVRDAETALLKMKILGTKVAQIIDGQLSEDAGIRDDLDDVFRIVPRSEPTILARARAVWPIWVRADAALAALTPPAAPITRTIQGVPQTAAMLKGLLDGYTGLVQLRDDAESLLNKKRGELRTLDRQVDRAAKDWYQIVKNSYDPGTPVYEALSQIPVETGMPAPEAIDIDELVQGGESGVEVLVSYLAGGGEHATTRQVEYQVEGVDADFGHAVALDASGNALGPFTVGQVVRVRTKVSNSVGTRTSAVRTITIEEPLEGGHSVRRGGEDRRPTTLILSLPCLSIPLFRPTPRGCAPRNCARNSTGSRRCSMPCPPARQDPRDRWDRWDRQGRRARKASRGLRAGRPGRRDRKGQQGRKVPRARRARQAKSPPDNWRMRSRGLRPIAMGWRRWA